MLKSFRWLTRVLPAVVVVTLTTACTEETVVFRDPFNDPVDSINGFLGYFSVADAQTTCGNCHADKGVAWEGTAHAEAWAGLQSSDFANDTTCGPCHSVSEQGNATTAPAGYSATFDSTYHDVQCESCHGPGIDHVQNTEAVQPLASLRADTASCGDCHEGSHHPFVEQWAQSAHGNVTGFASGRPGCNECHNGREALLTQFNESPVYIEAGESGAFDITCSVCHDPHGGPNEHQLRAPLDLTSSRNLCIKCHNRRTVPEPGGTHGPHGAQGPLLLADNIGWWPDGFQWNQNELKHAHGDPDVNEELCATCHVVRQDITDAVTGSTIHSVGHTFEAIPCYDGSGNLTDPPCSNDQFEACAQCHGGASEGLMDAFKGELTDYLLAVWDDVDDDGFLDAAPADTGLLPRLVADSGFSILDLGDTVHTVAEGVLFNAQIAWTEDAPWFADGYLDRGADTLHFSSHPTSGQGVHNPRFLREIMKASIAMLQSFYALPAPPAMQLQGPYRLPEEWQR
jgi:predicted CXXCH cytochrome family protein